MAMLKDSLITGDLRVTGTIYGNVPLNDLTNADDLKAIEALTGTSGILTKTAANTWALNSTATPASHTHGNLTNAGAIGSTADYAVYTTTNGVLTAGTLATTDPTASGSGITYIASVSQDSKGKISATKSTVRDASASQSGVVNTTTQSFAGAKTFTGGITAGSSKATSSSDHALWTTGITIHDTRYDTIGVTSLNKSANLFFTNSGMPNSNWWSGIHMAGWYGDYNAWELIGPSNSSDQRTTPLYVRSGRTTGGWGAWRQIYDTSNKPTKADVGLGNVANTTITVTSTSVSDGSNTFSKYTHPTGDGNLHVPATSTTNNGKFLKAGSTAGSISWASLTKSDVGLGNVANTTITVTSSSVSDGTHTFNKYTHPTGDGNLHVPATGTSNNGKVLKAGSTAGSLSWGTLSKSDVGLGNVANTTITVTSTSVSDGTNTFNKYTHPTSDGNKHVPANGTTNNGKFLQATATAGSYQWATPTDTKNTAGSTNSVSKIFLIGATSQAANPQTYSNGQVYIAAGTSGSSDGYLYARRVYNAVWNDYAEYRLLKEDIETPYGKVLIENGDDSVSVSTKRLQPGAMICSDTFGHCMGEEEHSAPISVAGRVLAYPLEPREQYNFFIGQAVCSGPNGTVSIMTKDEVKEYPECVVGYISAVPQYEEWGQNKIKVDGRVWIKIK